MGAKEVIEKVIQSSFWEVLIVVSVIVSVFGPAVGVIYGLSTGALMNIVLYSNILFVFDSAFRIYLYRKSYIYSIDFIIDISAIFSAALEYLFLFGIYRGPGIANLRVLRAFKLIGRMSKTIRTLVRVGKIFKGAGGASRYFKNKALRYDEGSRYVALIKQKMHSVLMLIMGYIILRFGSTIDSLSAVEEAKQTIFFFVEMIIVMIVIGGIIDFYLNKLIGQRFTRIESWVRQKSEKSGFFSIVHEKAHKDSTDEIDYLERYLGIVLDKAAEFPVSLRKFLWGIFKPKVEHRIIFLSDIENYSTKTSDMNAKAINSLIDEYIRKVVDILVFYGAEIDKYVGDSIIAYFDPQNADFVLEACHAIQDLKFKKDLRTRIGLNYGPVMQTYVGPRGYKQMDHFSDETSVAERIESHNKKTGTYILFSRSFYDLLSEQQKKESKYMGSFKPKGSKHKISVYTHER